MRVTESPVPLGFPRQALGRYAGSKKPRIVAGVRIGWEPPKYRAILQVPGAVESYAGYSPLGQQLTRRGPEEFKIEKKEAGGTLGNRRPPGQLWASLFVSLLVS